MIKKGDFFLVAVILAVVAAGYGGVKLYRARSENTHKVAVIRHNDKEVKRIELDTIESPQRIEITGSYGQVIHVILVEKGKIRFEQSDCPDQICVKTGWLTKKGDMTVCLPNRTVIKIEGQSEQIDGVTY